MLPRRCRFSTRHRLCSPPRRSAACRITDPEPAQSITSPADNTNAGLANPAGRVGAIILMKITFQ
jgi:hypothetical protein